MTATRRILFALLLFFTGMEQAQAASLWRHMGTDEGLDNLQTRQIISLPNGRMLLVVEGMIDLYDGQRFQSLELDRTLTADVHSFLGMNHYFDRRGRLWIRTLHQLTAIDVTTLRPLNVRQLLQEAGVGGNLQNFFIDGDGMAWMHVGKDSLMCYDWKAPARLVMRITDTNTDGILSSVCDVVGVGPRRYVFFSSGRMVCLEGEKVVYSRFMGEKSHAYYLRARAASRDTLLVRMVDNGERVLVLYDARRQRVAKVLMKSGVTDFFFDGMGDFWACDKQKIWHFDAQLRLKEEWDDAPTEIIAFAADHQGGLWTCSSNSGLSYRPSQIRRLPYESLPGEGAVTTFLTTAFGELWVGTSHGLFRQEGTGWTLLAGSRQGASLNGSGAEDWNVARLNQSSDGHVFVSTANRGLYELDAEGRILWNIDGHTDPKMRNNVTFCIGLPDGRRLLNTRLNRLIIYDPQTGTMDHLSERLPGAVEAFRFIVDVLPVEGGWLMATQNGLFFLEQCRKGTGQDYRLDVQRFAALADNPWSIKCNCLLRDRVGRIWVGTQNGLLCYEERSGDLKHYGRAEGLPNNCVQSMAEDGAGRLWLATMGGLCQLDVETGDTRTFDANDGMEDGSFMERAAICRTDGTLLFGTEHGLYQLSPDSLQLPTTKLVPQLMGLRIAGREGFVTGTRHIRLAYDQNFLTFTLSTLNYAQASHTRFCYRLQGIDPDWVTAADVGDHLELSYTALPPGRYELQVRASVQGGEWGEPLLIEIVVRPPLWRTWWAYLIYLLLAVGVVYYVGHSYVERHQMRQRIDELLREKDIFAQSGKEEEETESTESPVKEQKDISPADRRFLEKALGCIDRNMGNSEYTIDDFASDMAMERSTLYRKLQAVMGQGPLEFVRTIRLKRGAELLRTGKYNVTEVSELVGFNTPRYFTKHFREMYGVRPSEYR